MKQPTITDIAKAAGVSTGTVSAVINDKKTVKPETRKRVLSIIKQFNFRPRATARYMKQVNQEKSIGILIKDLNNPFYTSIAMAVKEYANEKGYLLFISSSENQHEYEERLTYLNSVKGIQGVIIAPVLDGDEEIEHLFQLKRINYPFVLLEEVKGIRANMVSIDNNKAMAKAVHHLIDLGHKRIVHFAGPKNASHALERMRAFRNVFSECHLVFKPEMIALYSAHYNESYDKTIKYFNSMDRADFPTAIICFNDQQALGVLAALSDMNIKVPEDISLIGNDDIYFAKLYPIPLTTIKAPMQDLGTKAAEILIRHIESEDMLDAERVIYDAELVIRDSTRALEDHEQK
ncbi:MAG: LacI family DNA-binding transcriptional regulator [candidate division KSB1 bacterium]|nr:LacI family DNA-binding transcriptional regulator [candidate division KSB1 bacterium]